MPKPNKDRTSEKTILSAKVNRDLGRRCRVAAAQRDMLIAEWVVQAVEAQLTKEGA